MHMRGLLLSLAAALLPFSVKAEAQPYWVACDGMSRPENIATSLGKVVASSATLGILFGRDEVSTYASMPGESGVQACTTALEQPVLDQFWVRKISILRSRAIHYTEIQNLDAALADMKAARDLAAVQKSAADLDRGLSVSNMLFEAALLMKKNNPEQARALILSASEARPYSPEITGAALQTFLAAPKYEPRFAALLDRYVKLNPDSLQLRAMMRDMGGDINGAADDWAIVARKPQFLSEPATGAALKPFGVSKEPRILAQAAIAAARAGRRDAAEGFLAELDALSVKAAQTDPVGHNGSVPTQSRAENLLFALKSKVQPDRNLAEATLLMGQGDAKGALQKISPVTPRNMPLEYAGADLLTKLSQHPDTAASVPAALVESYKSALLTSETKGATKIDVLAITKRLPPFEESGGVNAYKGQSFWGGDQGFNEKSNKGKNYRTVDYSRGSSVPINEEMALLRIAELTKADKKSGFILLAERKFNRVLVSTYYGVEQSRQPDGFAVSFDFVTVDPAALPAEYQNEGYRVILVDDVYAALAPVFMKNRQ